MKSSFSGWFFSRYRNAWRMTACRRLEISRVAAIRVKKREGALSITSDSTVIDFWARRARYQVHARIAIVFWTKGRKEVDETTGDGRERYRAHFNTSGGGLFNFESHRNDPLAFLMYRLRYALINARDRRVRAFTRVTIVGTGTPTHTQRETRTGTTKQRTRETTPRYECTRDAYGGRDALARASVRKHNQGRAGQKH